MATTLKDLRGKQNERRDKLRAIFTEGAVAGSQDLDMSKVTTLTGSTAEKVDQLRALNAELDDLSKQVEAHVAEHGDPAEFAAIRSRIDAMGDIDRPAIHGMPNGGGGSRQQFESPKSVGRMFVESSAYTGRIEKGTGPQAELDAGIAELQAATMLTTAGWAPQSIRMPGYVESAMRPIQVTDIVPTIPTSQAAVSYMEETTATNAAAERAEGGAYPESALALTERSVTCRSIGTSLPVSDEQLEDVDMAAAYVDGRLMFFIKQRLDGQILTGNGVGSNITGYLSATGLQTQAKGADSVPDAIYKAMTKVRVTGRAFPTHTIMHPTDWQNVRLLKTVDGIYIWGSPSEAGPERIWGSTVVQCDAGSVGTALVGDFSPAWSALAVRRGIEVQVGYVADNFKNGLVTVRGGLRAALVVYRGAAFCTATGL